MKEEILFNKEEIKQLFHEIRNLNFPEIYEESIYPAQPGLFMGNDILFANNKIEGEYDN